MLLWLFAGSPSELAREATLTDVDTPTLVDSMCRRAAPVRHMRTLWRSTTLPLRRKIAPLLTAKYMERKPIGQVHASN